MPPKPKIDRPPYTPVTPVTDTMIGPRLQPLFAASAPTGAASPARTTKKTLIGGSV